MTDFADLGIRIDTSEVSQGIIKLEMLTSAGGKAEGAVDRLGASASQTGTQLKGASSAAAAYAASVQRMAAGTALARNHADTYAKSAGLATHHTQNLTAQFLDLGVQIGSGGGLFRPLLQQGPQIAEIMRNAGIGVGGLAREFGLLTGIVKREVPALVAAAAAQAAAEQTVAAAAVGRAKAAAAAAREEIGLAESSLATAASAEAETAATNALNAARVRLAAINGEVILSERALATSSAATAEAETAAAAATKLRMGAIGPIAVGAAVGVGLLAATFKTFQAETRDSGHLEKYANSLGLTKKEMKELRQEVGGFTDDEMKDMENRVRAFEVTWGDVFNGLAKTASDALNLSPAWNKFVSDAESAFVAVLNKAAPFAALMKAFWTTDMGPGFWENVKKNAADAEKQISKNLETVRRNILSAAEDRISREANAITEDRTPKRGGAKKSDSGLADALAALDAQIKGQWKLAEAYQVSDAAAIKAAALQRAEEQAIRHKAEVGIFYEKELAKAVAQGAAEAAKRLRDLKFETDARKKLNDQIAAGQITIEQANQQMGLEAQLRSTRALAEEAQGDAKAKLLALIEDTTVAQAKANDEANKAKMLAETDSGKAQLDRLRLEAELIGKTNKERAEAIALLEAEQYRKANPIASAEGSPDYATASAIARDYINTQADAAVAAVELQEKQAAYNVSLTATADLLGLIHERTSLVGDALSNAFGGLGEGIATALTALTGFAAREEEIILWKNEQLQAVGANAAAAAQIEAQAAKKSQLARMQATSQALSGIKSLFGEHSKAYKVMGAVEKAYAAFQAAQTIASIARDAMKTTSHLANSAVRTTANTAEGGSKIFAELGPFAFPVVAAMVAVLAALGAKGGGGGGGAPSVPTAEDLQESAGTGSVLGDSKAKSESIQRALEIVADNSFRDLEYTNQMLRALRSIDLGIAKMSGAVARQIQVSGSMFDTSGLRLGSSSSSGFLGIGGKGLTRELYDLGLQLNSATVGNIIANGITGLSYRIVQETKTSKGLFGSSKETDLDTYRTALPADIAVAIQDVIISLRDGLVTAANVIGLEGSEALLNSFNVSLGKISFKGLSGEEIESQLNAIFSKVGDDMAKVVFPQLTEMQKVGEGLFETFVRVAREYEVVDLALKSIGRTFGQVGVDSVAARDALVQLFGGLDEFVERTDFFRDQFLSEAEQIAPVQASVRAEMERLGMASIATRDQFKQAVLGLDLTTAAGREMYASLLAVAPAFDRVLDYFEKANKAQIDALQSTVDQFTKFAESLRKYRDGLFATDAAQTNAYAKLKAQFVSTAALAATGDATALGGLESAGKAFLDAARNNASSREQYLRDIALVARGVDQGIFAAEETADYAQLQLDALKNATNILSSIATNTAATAAALSAAPAPQSAAPAGTSAMAPVPVPAGTVLAGKAPGAISAGAARVENPLQSAEIAELRAILEAVASNTFDTARVLRRWDRGDTLAVSTDGGDTLDTNLSSWGAVD